MQFGFWVLMLIQEVGSKSSRRLLQYGAIGAERMSAAAEILGLIVWIGERQIVGSASNISLTECARGTSGETCC